MGNLHFAEGKTQISKTVSIGESEKEALKKLADAGIEMEIRRVPSEGIEADIKKFL
ncbi:MAG: PTS sugar transporter subunit IIB [Eubacterium sp.]